MTAADVARCRVILDAWNNGAAREEDLAELRKLLPGVLASAEPTHLVWAEACSAAKVEVLSPRLEYRTLLDAYAFGYYDGALRKHRAPR